MYYIYFIYSMYYIKLLYNIVIIIWFVSNADRRSAESASGIMSIVNSQSVLHALLLCLDSLHGWSHQKMMQTLTASSAYGKPISLQLVFLIIFWLAEGRG